MSTTVDGTTIEERLHDQISERLQVMRAELTDLSLEDQLDLAGSASPDVRTVLAGNATIFPEVQELLAADATISVHCALAGNRALTARLQAKVLKEYLYAATSLARNRSLDPGLQMQVARESSDARVAIASRGDLRPDVQDFLAKDAYSIVRMKLAENTALGLSAQHVLSFDPHETVRRCLAGNRSVVWNVEMGARAVRVGAFALYCATVDGLEEDVNAFLPTWHGSLKDLVEAIGLTHR